MAFFKAPFPRRRTTSIPFHLHSMHPIAFVLALIYKAAPVIKSRKALSGTTEFSPILGKIPCRVCRAVEQTSVTPTFLPFLKTCG
jgi:hypothetical protein